jgi:hypothetical protein
LSIENPLPIGIREHKAAQHQEKSHTAIATKLKTFSNDVEQHNEQDEKKTK